MQVNYLLDGKPHTYDPGASENPGEITRKIEEHLRQSHPEFAGRDYLAEKIADGLLNSLAGDGTVIELGDLS